MNIIKSDILSSEHDIMWQDTPENIRQMAQKPVLIVANHSEDDSNSVAQLQKMLDASNLSPDVYNLILLTENRRLAWHQLHHLLGSRIVFLVGILPLQLGVSAMFKLNEPNHFNDTIWLPTLSIAGLAQHADAKKQLWVMGMKPLFVDKLYGEFEVEGHV